MRIFLLSPVLFAATPLLADACLDEVKAMYLEDGGVFDPAFDIQHQEVTFNRMPDGTEQIVVTARWQAPDQVISAFPDGRFMLLWGQDSTTARRGTGRGPIPGRTILMTRWNSPAT